MKHYSFLSEMKINETDVNFLTAKLAELRQLVENTDGASELDSVLDKVCEELKTTVSDDKLKAYNDVVKNMRKKLVEFLCCNITQVKIQKRYDGSGATKKDFLRILTPDYIVYLASKMDDSGFFDTKSEQ